MDASADDVLLVNPLIAPAKMSADERLRHRHTSGVTAAPVPGLPDSEDVCKLLQQRDVQCGPAHSFLWPCHTHMLATFAFCMQEPVTEHVADLQPDSGMEQRQHTQSVATSDSW